MIQGFEIVKSADIYNDMVDYAHKGALKGKYLGFPHFHKNYTMSLPGVTDWTGFPQSGKTQVLMEFLLNTSEWYGWKHLVYFPDVGNEKEIIADLIQKRCGKTFDKRFANHITEFEITTELDWILEHFKIVTKKDLKASLTPIQFWDMGVELSKNIEGGIQTMSVDSWKDLKHNTQEFGRDDKYLEHVLSYRNAIAERYNMHIHTIIHPTRTEKDDKGNRKPPGPYDLKGGTEWFNNGKCMITVHRPDKSKNEVEVHTTKIKPRSVGNRGIYKMYFDVGRFRYYYYDNGNKLYAQHLKNDEIEVLENELIEKAKETNQQAEKQASQQSQVANLNPEDPDDLPF